jgi:hypothetical protein
MGVFLLNAAAVTLAILVLVLTISWQWTTSKEPLDFMLCSGTPGKLPRPVA